MSWLIIFLTLLLFLIIYFLWLRPRHLRGGASDPEVSMNLPGDELVSNPFSHQIRLA